MRKHGPKSLTRREVLKAAAGAAGLAALPGGLHAESTPEPIVPRRGFFIYGGFWKAAPESPRGLQNNALYGRSSNQELLTGSTMIDLEPDDHVFLRSTQSEDVMLDFGDLVFTCNSRVVDRWPVLQTAGA